MNLRCKDCKVTFDSPYNKDCPFCGSDAFVVELLHENKETEPDYWMIRGEIWSDDIAFLEAHNGTSSEVQAAMEEWENNAVPLYKYPVTTDKLSVEKLQEHLLPYKKEMVQKIIDEKMQLVTADEFVKLHKESLTAIREKDELQEQLNTAKKALIEIASHYLTDESYEGDADYREIAIDALAAIGGDDD